MNEKRSKGCLIAAAIWFVILGLLAVAYRYLVHPHLAGRLEQATSGTSQYKDEIVVAADSFSGYCLLRSEALKEDLKRSQIRLVVKDDKANYRGRLESLRDGEVQLAAFTVDSLIMAGARMGEFPGSIVMVIDETQGGDAVVAYQSGLASLQDLNHGSARIVLVPNSPSEFLARVVLAHFNLPGLPSQWLQPAENSSAVMKQFREASPTDKKAFVMWEPYVSRALQQKGAHVLLDSSRVRGYIVDVLVAQRRFLSERPDLVKAFVEAYARASYRYHREPEGLVKLVIADARQLGVEALDEVQARKVVQGIRWKNLLENYAHFRLSKEAANDGMLSLEDMIANVVDVLIKTKALTEDPLAGRHHTLFYGQVLAELKSSQFHPGRDLNLITNLPGSDLPVEALKPEAGLRALTDEEWRALRAVGELRVAPIIFRRASAEVSLDSERDLQELARRLQGFPQFYVRVIGHARPEGDPEANRALALARAEAAARLLMTQGLAATRVRAEATLPVSGGAEAQAVSFFVGQLPY